MQQSALTLGTLALGGLALAGLHDWSNATSTLPLIVFLLVVPAVSYVSVFVWLGEYARTTRAGCFLVGIEEKVNRAAAILNVLQETRALQLAAVAQVGAFAAGEPDAELQLIGATGEPSELTSAGTDWKAVLGRLTSAGLSPRCPNPPD